MRILSVVSVKIEKKSGYGYLEEIVLFNLDDDVIVYFVTALKMFTRGIIVMNRVEDMQLGVKSYHILVKEPYTSGYDPLGIIYEDKSKKKRLMHVDEIHKFCDGTL
nr:hypothetical protein [Tanacetum cinerariifolium]